MLHTDTDPGFRKFLVAIERFPVLDRQRELTLAHAYRRGDKSAGDLLVSCSLRHIVRIAAGYRGYGFRPSELVAEGNVGLVQALRRFEPERELRFMTYAAYWVRARMLSHILQHWSLVGLGTSPMQSKLFFGLAREKARLAAHLGEAADLTAQLAAKFECSEARIRMMERRVDSRDLSLHNKAYRDGDGTLMDALTDDDVSDQEAVVAANEACGLVRDRIAAELDRLDEREQMIVRRRLLGAEKPTLSELGRQLGVSRERVRQLEKRVKVKLRRTLSDLAPAHAMPMAAA